MSRIRIVGVDPGFANLGLCIVDLFPLGGSDLIATQLITTSPEKGKSKNIDDEIRRLCEIEDLFLGFIDQHQPDVLAMEEPGKCLMMRAGKWATNPSLLRTSCLSWGAIHGICRTKGIYCLKVGAQEIKKTLCNSKKASKADVISAAQSKYPAFTDWPKSKKVEHVADAVGAAVTSFSDPVVMVMTRKLRTEV